LAGGSVAGVCIGPPASPFVILGLDPRIHAVISVEGRGGAEFCSRCNALASRHGSSGLRRVASLLASPVDDEFAYLIANLDVSRTC